MKQTPRGFCCADKGFVTGMAGLGSSAEVEYALYNRPFMGFNEFLKSVAFQVEDEL